VKIVLCMFQYLPAAGGSVRGLQMLAEGFAGRGHDVSVVTMLEPGLSSQETINGVRVVRLKMRHFAGIRRPIGYGKAIASLKPDVVEINGNHIWAMDFYRPADDDARARVINLHGLYHAKMRGGLLQRVYHNTYLPAKLALFDAVVTQTQEETEFVVSRGYPRERVHLIQTGVDVSEFWIHRPNGHVFRTERKLALYAGGLFDNKRVDRIIRAVGLTKGEWELVVIGPDVPGSFADLAHCREIAKKTGAKVRFLGAVERGMVLDAFHSADAYVQGSSFEGFGLAILEAMAADLPFVAFDAGAARDLAATGAGRVVESPEEMARMLAEIPEWYVKGTGPKAAEERNSDRTVERHIALYESLVRC
jgi:1,2-diacylglycerol 3-alpha-glucosyltransferase